MVEDAIKAPAGGTIAVVKDGLMVKKPPIKPKDSSDDTFVFPVNEEISWEDDFYSAMWQQSLHEPLILVIQVKAHFKGEKDAESIGYVMHNLCKSNGKLKSSMFEFNLFEPPLKFAGTGRTTQDKICFSIGEAVTKPKSTQFLPNA